MGLFRANYDRPGPGIEKNAPKKKGLDLFFSLYFNSFWELLKLDLLFLVCCIPVVTIPAAWAAMTRVACRIADDQVFFFWEEYKNALKTNWKRATLYGFCWAALLGIFLFSAWFYNRAFAGNAAMTMVFSGLFSLLTLVLIFHSFYFYPILVLVDQSMKDMVKNATLLSVVALKNTILILLPVAAFWVVTVLYFPFSVLLSPFLLSTVCYIAAFGCLGPIKKYILRQGEEDATQE